MSVRRRLEPFKRLSRGESAPGGRPLDEEVADVLRRGGLTDVTVTLLDEVLELDREHGVAPGHNVQVQYVVTGSRG